MGPRLRLIRLAFVLALGSTTIACSSSKSGDDATKGQQEKPPDHLAAGEVVEGKDRAFGLPLPRVARVAARFADSVDVMSPLSAEELANFVRARVKGGDVTPGTTMTKLADVTPRDDATKRLTIEIRSLRMGDGTKSEMIVRDTTPAPVLPGLTDEQRWNKAGLTPDGKVADPKHLQ